ncbi:hypothetical protein ACMA5I_00440 [Paracoccaceae bacterium GXU_MW_L88]
MFFSFKTWGNSNDCGHDHGSTNIFDWANDLIAWKVDKINDIFDIFDHDNDNDCGQNHHHDNSCGGQQPDPCASQTDYFDFA